MYNITVYNEHSWKLEIMSKNRTQIALQKSLFDPPGYSFFMLMSPNVYVIISFVVLVQYVTS